MKLFLTLLFFSLQLGCFVWLLTNVERMVNAGQYHWIYVLVPALVYDFVEWVWDSVKQDLI